MDGACAALGDPAPVFRSRQPELLANDPEKRRLRVDIDLPHGPVHCQAGHRNLSGSARSDLADTLPSKGIGQSVCECARHRYWAAMAGRAVLLTRRCSGVTLVAGGGLELSCWNRSGNVVWL